MSLMHRAIRVQIGSLLLFLIFLLFLIPSSLVAAYPQKDVKIGVLAETGPQKAMEKWGATAQYLTKAVPDHRFSIVPLNFEEVHTSVVKAQVDFLVTNSAVFVLLAEDHGSAEIATMKRRWHHRGVEVLGGVVFVRENDHTINNFSDLKDKTFMAVDQQSFGGWLIARFEFYKTGINPYRDFKSLIYGTTHDNVVFAVRDQIADAGTVRTGILERMANEGKIDLNNFKIVNSKLETQNFPFVRSTDLYPEWPFAKLAHTSNELSEKVTAALLNMPAYSLAATAARITGWTVPLDYKPVHHFLKELKVGQYKALTRINLLELIRKYPGWFIASPLLLCFMAGILFYVSFLNKKLKTAHSKIEEAHSALEIKVENRTKALKDSEKKYRELADSLPQIIFESDMEGHLVYVNQNALTLFKYTREQFDKGINFFDVIAPGDHDWLLQNVQRVIDNKSIADVEYTALRSDNTTFPVLVHANLITENGKLKGFRGLLIDITKRRTLESELKKRALALDHSSDTILITDINGIITYVNPAFEKITGYPCKKALGKNPKILKSGQHDPSFYRELWETISNGKTWAGRLINRKKDGTHYTEDATISPVFSDKGQIINYVAVKRDVTEQLKLEIRLRQSQKMESIGTLAGGIAHDFNNILFPILGYTEMMLDDIPADNPFQSKLNKIYKSALRARDLVQQILTFSRQEKGELKLMEMQPVIKEALKMIRSIIPTTIEIKQDLQPDCGAVTADPTQIHQIVMNLATNAYHAMEEDGGDLGVRLKQVEFEESDLFNPDLKPGQYACLRISDTGRGMDKELKKKIFDPFFTTKEVGKGTGMGLSVVHGIVTEMKGAIHVYSESERGTEFHVYLPLAKPAEKQQVSGSGNIETPIQFGTEHILIVDDENAIIGMEKDMLKRLGYKVTSHTSSMEALEAFRAAPDAFDLVITDLSMPDISGDKLSSKINSIRPGIPVLLCTGFSETMSEEKAASLGIKGFLLKPIVMKDFSYKIREVLDK